jgi:methylated-DNA-[protein]-cysteine S-methyltransferase
MTPQAARETMPHSLFDDFMPVLTGPPELGPSDVSYVTEDTAVGRMLLAVTTDGTLVTCAYAPDTDADARWLARLAASVSPRVLHHRASTDAARRALENYLAGRARTMAIATDLALATSFQRRVLRGLAGVGYGERTTYAALASTVDTPRAARAVGTALGGNPLCIAIPCHRVLPASGGVGGYAGGAAAKQYLLTLESGHH